MADEESSLRQVRFVVQASLDIDTQGFGSPVFKKARFYADRVLQLRRLVDRLSV